MDYLQASKRFNLDSFLQRVQELSFLEIISEVNREVSNIEASHIGSSKSNNDIRFLQREYLSNLKALNFLLGQGIKPIGVDRIILDKFKPLLERLVEKGNLRSGILHVLD